MENEQILSEQQIAMYLDRLGFHGQLQPDLQSLNRLLFAQLTQVPFDSMDVWGAGLCPSLDVEMLFRKIVANKRGGYCFELNTLFRVLLNSLGFEAYQAVACLLNEDYTPQPPAHNVIVCIVDGRKYLVDVGYGGPVPYEALELKPGQYGKFILRQDGALYILERKEGERRRPFIQFRDIPAARTDLVPLNFYISQNPESHFRHILHLNQRKSDGSLYVLDGREFKIKTQDGETVQQLETVEQLKEVLRRYYNIDPAHCKLRDEL